MVFYSKSHIQIKICMRRVFGVLIVWDFVKSRKSKAPQGDTTVPG